jgi:hypothetical protein
VHMTFQKYRFAADGSYIGYTLIVETDTLHGDHAYTGHAVTTVYDALGHLLVSFDSTSTAVRMTT